MKTSKRHANYVPHERKPYLIEGTSLAKQSMAAECDINNILKKIARTGDASILDKPHENFGDYIDMPTYQEAQNQIIQANEMFMQLPAELRSRFGNSAATFLDFAQDEDNKEEMIKMGLIAPIIKKPAEDPNPPKADPKPDPDPAD